MKAREIESLIKKFRWNLLHKMYGCAHSSIIGFISTEWLSQSIDKNSILDGAPAPITGNGRTGQKNADILLCQEDKPIIPVEVETKVDKYSDKINSIVAYIDNKIDFDGIEFGMLFMTNLCNGKLKYKHNWDFIKQEVLNKKKYSIALISIIKQNLKLGKSTLDNLKNRNDYYPWEILAIDYWIIDKYSNVKEGTLWKK
jgi:hypothetical protein